MVKCIGLRPLLVVAGSLVLVVLVALITLSLLSVEQTQPPAISQQGIHDSNDTRSAAALGMSGMVEYTVWDASGRVKDHGIINNTINAQAFDETYSRLFVDNALATAGYDAIAALSVAPGVDDPSDGVSAGSITLALDGDSGSVGNQNPAEGVVVAPSDGSGRGTVSATFTAQVVSADVQQIVLTKANEDNTLDGAAAISDADIFSFVDVPDISLNNGDSVAYTWTIDVD